MRASLSLLTALLISATTLSFSAAAAEIAITPSPPYGNKAQPEDINWAYKTVMTTPGATAAIFTAPWAELTDSKSEKAAELKTASFFSAQLQHPSYLGLNLVDADMREVPDEFRKARWTKSEMLLSIDDFLQETSTITGKNIRWLSLGDKVDVYLAESPDEAEAFLSFYKKAAVSARRAYPNAKVGLTVTYEGLVGPRKDIATKLIEASDAAFISYAPFTDKVRSVEDINKELDELLVMPLGRTFVFQDISFPSANSADSSEELQAEVLSAMLQKLKSSPGVDFVNLRQLHDLPPSECRALEKRYKKTPEFAREPLCSTGLFTTSGKPKKSWRAVQNTLAPAEPPVQKSN